MIKFGLLFTIMAALSACTTTEIDPLDASFGHSVKHMISAQTYETYPSDVDHTEVSTGIDGKLSRNVYKTYTKSSGKKDTVKKADSLKVKVN